MPDSRLLLLPENTIEIVKGTNRTLEVVITDLDCEPIDITGGRVVLSVKETIDDEFPLIQLDSLVPAEGSLTEPRIGKAQMLVVPANTQNLQTDFEYLYDVWYISATSKRFAVVPPSPWFVRNSITRIPL